MFDTCFYHKCCSDGTASAWCVKQKIENVHLIAINPADTNIDFKYINNKSVIFVDVCADKQILIKICEKAKDVIILDHHKTNKSLIDSLSHIDNLKIIFDIDKAGCQIAWDYFNEGIIRPWFIDYIADRDLWKWELENSKLITSALYSLKYITIDGLNNLFSNLDKQDEIINQELIPYAKVIEKYENELIEKSVNSATEVEMIRNDSDIKYTIWLGTITSHLRSELGNQLSLTKFKNGKAPDFSAIWNYDYESDEWYISLRGVNDKFDLSEIAKSFGGGGHKKAAGFKIKGKLQSVFK